MKNQRGQIIVILLLVMLVVLSVVLAITQRTTVDLSTSTETDQSTKAYSAAEAGLEQALQRGNANPSASPIVSQSITLNGNAATATIQNSGLLPRPGSTIGIEYPPIGKESVAQFWLTDTGGNSNYNYKLNTFTVYFGNPKSIKDYDDSATPPTNITPAIEVTTIKQLTTSGVTSYESQKNYFDPLSSRATTNNFVTRPSVVCNDSTTSNTVFYSTILKANSPFYCKADVTITNCSPSTCIPQLVRIRLLYANANHKIALIPSSGGSLPPQVELYTSTGKSGQSQKTLQVFRIKEMLPPWLDFAIFSFNDIIK